MTNEPEQRRSFPIQLVVAAVLVVLVVILVFQNSQTVTVNIFLWELEGRLIWTLLGVAFLGFLAGLALPRFRR